MPPATENSETRAVASLPWTPLAWFGVLIIACHAPVLQALVRQWYDDQDMGHGFFVPAIAAYIAWQKREELLAQPLVTNWWGLLIVVYAALQSYLASLGAELFLARTAFVFSLIGAVLFLGGTRVARALAFPLFLLFFMVPIPAILYNQVTFPLQLLASRTATTILSIAQIPVLREGNILELPNKTLSVVEACSGIRSLLSLSFLSLVYGYFFEKSARVRIALFLSTIPIAVLANSSRVTFTGILAELKPDLAEGFFHILEGWVIFMVALAMLVAFHRILLMGCRAVYGQR